MPALQRRDFLRLAAQSAAFVTAAGVTGCGGSESDTVFPITIPGATPTPVPSPIASPTPAPSPSTPVVSRATFDVRYLLPIGATTRKKATGRATDIGGVSGVRLGKINNRGDVAAVIFGTDGNHDTTGIYRDGVVTPTGVPISTSGIGVFPLDLNDNGQMLITQLEAL